MAAVVVLCVSIGCSGVRSQLPDPVATFSILGYDPATGEIGGAVQSRVFSVGQRRAVGRGRRRRRRDAGDRRRELRPERARAAARGHGAGGDHQGDLGQRSRSAARQLDQAGPAVCRDRRQGQHRRLHRARRPSTWAGHQAGQVQHRAGQHPRRRSRSSRTWSRRSKRRPGICRCG